ncbi:MAG TPA: formate C-acetyltransferase/glycerol dehydratase family glycyl radical enzyme, partial [Candidatus Acetothermia bacterium]|nr:formate C-acetyltransferase/glycerol dehydratase family glycyl radical enzyme [Candidatus Acetothermia bacterium]
MNKRIERLLQESRDAIPRVSAERARLLTEFYSSSKALGHSVPVTRALAFSYLLANKSIFIGDGELIVGERGPAPKSTPTYPELCSHSADDLRLLDTRLRTPFAVSEDAFTTLTEEVIPFWRGRSMREKVFAAMTSEWQQAFDAGVFTEFMEQRSPGHAVLDDKIYHHGLLDFIKRIEDVRARIDWKSDPRAYDEDEELYAMKISAEAMINLAERYADLAREMAEREQDPRRRDELASITEVCEWVPAHAPRSFWEAIQMYWFVHLGVVIELNSWDSFNPGRLDQHLSPFYERELASGTLTRDQAKELLECLWIKFSNQPAPPKVGITVEQSATYNDFVLVNTGGLTENGEDAVDEVSYLILDVIGEMRLPFSGSCIQLSKKNPNRFLKAALRVVRKGFGQPSIFNTDAIVQEFLRAGKSIQDARNGGPSGCVTISAFGRESCVLTGYMNWPKILEIALHNGIDPRSGEMVGIETGDVREFKSFDQLFSAYRKQLEYFIDLKIAGNSTIERLYSREMPAPFLSLLVDDCITRGRDYNDGGPRYPTTYIQGVGLGTTTDALSAIKERVFEKADLLLADLVRALDNNFDGAEGLRKRLAASPAFGNDDDRADDIARAIFDAYFEAIDGRANTNGGSYRINLLPTTVHIYFGRMVGATANGRAAGTPLSDGISPSQGADTRGPTAVVRSMGKIDHVRTGGTLLNQKFLPSVLADDSGIDKLAALVRTYFRYDGHHIQFNVVGVDTLHD